MAYRNKRKGAAQNSTRPRGAPPAQLWKKGAASPNPGGRPAVFAEVRAAAQLEGPASIQKLAEIRDNPRAPFIAQIAACNSLLDRGYGRPPQAIAVSNLPALPDPKLINQAMTPAEAAEQYALTLKQGQHDLDNLLEAPAVATPEPEGES